MRWSKGSHRLRALSAYRKITRKILSVSFVSDLMESTGRSLENWTRNHSLRCSPTSRVVYWTTTVLVCLIIKFTCWMLTLQSLFFYFLCVPWGWINAIKLHWHNLLRFIHSSCAQVYSQLVCTGLFTVRVRYSGERLSSARGSSSVRLIPPPASEPLSD